MNCDKLKAYGSEKSSDSVLYFVHLPMTPLFASDPPENRLCVIGETDPFLARLLRRFAGKTGLRSKSVQTGEALIEIARHEQPALVILEPDLPGKMRGWEAAQILQTEELTREIPLVICTWWNEADARALVGQTCSYLQKPDLHYPGFTAALDAAGFKIISSTS